MAVRELPSQEELCKLLDYDPETGFLTWKPRPPSMFTNGRYPNRYAGIWNARYAGKRALNCPMPHGHLHGRINDQGCLAHRVIWKMVTGCDPQEIDHINGDPADNRWCNLRKIDHPTNGRNLGRGKHNTSGTTGVSFAKRVGKWHAYIQDRPGHRVNLGWFENREDASAARKAAERRFGYHSNHGQRPSFRS